MPYAMAYSNRALESAPLLASYQGSELAVWGDDMGANLNVLIVTDSERLTTLLVGILRNGRFRPTWRRAHTARDLRAALMDETWDVVLAEDGLDGLGTQAVLDQIAKINIDIPMIVISDRRGLEPYVQMVKQGVGDFVGVGELRRLTRSVRKALEERDAQREERRLLDEVRHHANHDSLTGLPNRRLFDDRLAQGLKRARRQGNAFSVLFVDLDHFKEINDSLGHAIGDRLLIEVAARLEHNVRESDTVARLAGDEFTIILENTQGSHTGEQVAGKILGDLARPYEIDGRQIAVTASLGIANYPADGTDADVLLSHADSAMYRAKSRGRNGYQLFQPESGLSHEDSTVIPFAKKFRSPRAAWAIGIPALAAALLAGWFAVSALTEASAPAGPAPVAETDQFDEELDMETAAGPDTPSAGD